MLNWDFAWRLIQIMAEPADRPDSNIVPTPFGIAPEFSLPDPARSSIRRVQMSATPRYIHHWRSTLHLKMLRILPADGVDPDFVPAASSPRLLRHKAPFQMRSRHAQMQPLRQRLLDDTHRRYTSHHHTRHRYIEWQIHGIVEWPDHTGLTTWHSPPCNREPFG